VAPQDGLEELNPNQVQNKRNAEPSSGIENNRGKEDTGTRCFQKIFAILLLIERPGMISSFVRESVCDDDLPLELGGSWPYITYRRGARECRLKCFLGWRRSTLQRFQETQWKLLVPVFPASNSRLDDPPSFGDRVHPTDPRPSREVTTIVCLPAPSIFSLPRALSLLPVLSGCHFIQTL